jgi:enediyne biosynthesis protein E4
MRRFSLFFNSCALLFILVLVDSCSDSNKRDQLFTKLPSSKTGIRFQNLNAENEDYNVFVYEYFYNGGGVALGDINNDGLVDIYFSSNQRENKLYLNKGNFEFEDISKASGTAAPDGWKTGVSMADVNSDGLLDIYVCRSAANEPQQRRNSLFINQGNLTFVDQAKEFGLDNNSYSTQAAFLDFDRDGDLDIFLLNHAVSRIVRNFDIRKEKKTDRIPYVGNLLFENRNKKFINVSDSVGIYGPAHNFGLGISCSDLNNDGWVDIYTSNDYTGSDKLLINNNATFDENELSLLTHISRFSMGSDIADINNDGLSDIYSLDMLPDNNKRQKELMWADNYDIYTEMVRNGLHHQFMRNMLHLNNGQGPFSEIGQLAGISNTDWSWSALFADYDNDGFQDLFVSNGYKRDYTNSDFAKYRADQMLTKQAGGKSDNYTTMLERMPSTKIHNYLFKNTNGYQFVDQSDSWGMSELNLTNGAAYADLDNDGDIDLVMNNMDSEAGIYRNNAEMLVKNNFLKVKLQGAGNNTFGIGARVIIYFNGGLAMREMYPNRGFESSVEPLLHFGLGKSSKIDSLVVTWGTGKKQTVINPAINQQIQLRESDAISKPLNNINAVPFYSEATSVVDYKHEENNFIDFKVQPLLTRLYSFEGPALAAGDVDGDGRDDIYLGGAKDQAGQLFLQNSNANYVKKTIPQFDKDKAGEDTDAVFFDIDSDGDKDLYVVKGGSEFSIDDPLLQDKLYRNDHGQLHEVALPAMPVSGSCARPADIDHDGDLDLFVGGRITPGRYPHTPLTYLLLNDGNGNFTVDESANGLSLRSIGMVTDATWIDLHHDSFPELVIVGEWMKVMIFENEKGKLKEATKTYFPKELYGFWNTILPYDFDGDGDVDFIAGNQGLNNQIKPSQARPATLYYKDFDDNGSVDPVLCYFIKDKSYPFPTRDELVDQLPMLKKKFTNYASYTNVTFNDIFSKEQRNNCDSLKVNCFETTYFRNDGKKFTIAALPIQMQFSPVCALAVADVNADGSMDLIAAGNFSKTKARTGMLNGNGCFVFLNDAKGNFRFLETAKSGINFNEDVKHLLVNKNKLLVIPNNGKVRTFVLRK